MCSSLLMQGWVKPFAVTLPMSRGIVQFLEEETRSQFWPWVQATLSRLALAARKMIISVPVCFF